ncbi:sporulation protein YqfD [Solibacillus silvestris]|uniref:sporulation protein YqfD n=1 Tax=Solibacillus silvestris TaxID=76853 RepID=UPI003F81A458
MNATYKKLITIKMKQSSGAAAFIALLKQHKIRIYQLNFSRNEITFQVARSNISMIRKLRKKAKVKILIRYTEPDKILQKDFVTVIGMLALIVLPLLLSRFIWQIEVDANTVELEDEVANYLEDEMDVQFPVRKNAFYSDNEIRQIMMRQFREFSWVHIMKNGSKITITPQLAPKIEPLQNENKNQHLIATNSGVVTHFKIERGIRQVEQNMTVYRGDILVSGILKHGDDEIIIGAGGEVFADYWLETSFSIPKNIEMEVLDDYGWKYNINWKQVGASVKQKSFEPLKSIVTYKPYRTFHKKRKVISEEDIQNFILPLLHEKMIYSLPLESAIKAEKLLHVYTDDDTVKGKVLYLINENIAKPHPIHQGE